VSGGVSIQRGEAWLADLDPTLGHEQGGRRPVLVVSVDSFNAGLSGLVVVLPLTTRVQPLPLHVPVDPREGGLRPRSAILCDATRSIGQRRLLDRWGTITAPTMATVEDRLRRLLGL
jgi:mRNA interferase MazF